MSEDTDLTDLKKDDLLEEAQRLKSENGALQQELKRKDQRIENLQVKEQHHIQLIEKMTNQVESALDGINDARNSAQFSIERNTEPVPEPPKPA